MGVVTATELEERWVAAWTQLLEMEKQQGSVVCILPDGRAVEVAGGLAWLQESAYAGYKLAVEPGWYQGKPAAVVARALDAALLPEPWEAVESGSGLERELERELSEGHALYGCVVSAIARRRDADDVLFSIRGGGFAVVHLTWSSERSQEWPHATIREHWRDALAAAQ